MIKPDKRVFESIQSLRGRKDWTVFLEWLNKVSQSETNNAIRSANPQICGAAAILNDIIEIINGSEESLNKLSAKNQ